MGSFLKSTKEVSKIKKAQNLSLKPTTNIIAVSAFNL